MINKMIGLVARLTVGKQVVGAVAWVHNKLDGRRSEISLSILVVVHGLKLAGIINAQTADAIEKAIAAILPLTLMDKASKVMSIVDNIVPAPVVSEPAIDTPTIPS